MRAGLDVADRSPSWPETIWDAPLLRGLDARSRQEIARAGRLRPVQANEVVYRAGDPADALFVVASGAVALVAVRRGEAEATTIRRASCGDVFGEESVVVDFASRQMDARSDESGVVAEIPVAVLRRALGRGGDEANASRLERGLRRAATLDLLRTTSFTRSLPDREIEILLDAAVHEHVARGRHVYREGDDSTRAYLVADGLLQMQTEDEGKPRIEGYLGRGDLFGDDELEDRSRRRTAIVASGPAWLVGIPRDVFLVVARRQRGALDAAIRMRVAELPPRLPGGVQTTAHVFQDLYRMRVARSLLVIDQDSCIRCGHCAWSCASTHDDGISRLVRRGDKIVVGREDAAPALGNLVASVAAATAPLLVPNSCQHCKNPSCMIDCPTGAIGRDARGEVFIREDLCTGCGSCAKACPWDNIQIAPRSASASASASASKASGIGSAYPEVAVKCDLCSGSAAGPACVASCPTQAIARIDPNAALAPLRTRKDGPIARTRVAASASASASPPDADALAASLLPSPAPAWPWVTGAGLAAVGLASMKLGPWTSGVVAGVLVVALVAYSGLKRSPRLLARVRTSGAFARALYIAHLAVGIVTMGAVAQHGRLRVPGDLGGALTLAMLLALVTGAFGAIVNVLVPRRLSRLERKSVLPEELGARLRELDERVFARLSGKSEVVKTLYGRVLRPYRASRVGALVLIASGRSLREEESRVRAQMLSLVAGHKGERTTGLDELARLVVERRGVVATRLLTFVLRGWISVHLAATATSIVLLVAHVIAVAMGPR